MGQGAQTRPWTVLLVGQPHEREAVGRMLAESDRVARIVHVDASVDDDAAAIADAPVASGTAIVYCDAADAGDDDAAMVHRLRERHPGRPMVALCRDGAEARRLSLVQAGADETLPTNQTTRASLERALALAVARHSRAHDAEGQMRFVLQHTPVTLYRLDPDCTIRYVNRAAPGLDVSQVVGTNLYDWIPPELHGQASAVFDEVFENGRGGEYEVQALDASGRPTTYACRVTPLFDNGIVTGAMLLVVDVQMLRAVARAMPAEHGDASAQQWPDSGPPELADLTAEQMEVPLRPILRQLAVLQDGNLGPLNAQQHLAMDIVTVNLRRLHHLLEWTTDLAALQCGRLSLRLDWVRLDRSIEDALLPLVQTGDAADLRFIVDIHGPLKVQGDGPRLERMLRALLTATRDEAAPGSTIRVKAWPGKDHVEVQLDVEGPNAYWDLDPALPPPPGTEEAIARRANEAQMIHGFCKGIIEAHGGRTLLSVGPHGARIAAFRIPIVRVHDPVVPHHPVADATPTTRAARGPRTPRSAARAPSPRGPRARPPHAKRQGGAKQRQDEGHDDQDGSDGHDGDDASARDRAGGGAAFQATGPAGGDGTDPPPGSGLP